MKKEYINRLAELEALKSSLFLAFSTSDFGLRMSYLLQMGDLSFSGKTTRFNNGVGLLSSFQIVEDSECYYNVYKIIRRLMDKVDLLIEQAEIKIK